ncbi:unnamed protein product, partial [Dovyalis caffra]
MQVERYLLLFGAALGSNTSDFVEANLRNSKRGQSKLNDGHKVLRQVTELGYLPPDDTPPGGRHRKPGRKSSISLRM